MSLKTFKLKNSNRTLEEVETAAAKVCKNNCGKLPTRAQSATGRQFPNMAYLSIGLPTNEDGQWSSADSTKKYVAEYERQNKLKPWICSGASRSAADLL